MTPEEICTKFKDELNKKLEGIAEVLSVAARQCDGGWLLRGIFMGPAKHKQMYFTRAVSSLDAMEIPEVFDIWVNDTAAQLGTSCV